MASAERLIALCRANPNGADPRLRDLVARSFIAAEAYRWHTYKTATGMLQGRAVGAEASLGKLFWSELDLALHETALALLGPHAEVSETAAHGGWMKGYQFALAGPIYAGTNEIQRNIVAERVLGLPRK